MRSMPLTPGDIAVVAIFWLVMVFAGKWLLGRLRRYRKKAASAKKKADIFQYPAAPANEAAMPMLFLSCVRGAPIVRG